MSDILPLPASAVGRRRSPAHQLLTLFGDYWWRVEAPMPTGAVLAAMADLGVKGPAARASLARLVERGLMEMTKAGRRTSHALTSRAREIVAEEAAWLRRFGRDEPEWDGKWSAVFFSIPEKERPLRHAARTRLRWLGYAPLYDGVWISPFDSIEQVATELGSLGVEASSLRGALSVASGDSPMRAWDLGAVEREYDEFLLRVRGGVDELREGVTPEAALVLRTGLMLTWQSFRQADPGHPVTLMPPDWPRHRARSAFVALYDGLGSFAEQRMREHIARIDPALAGFVAAQRLT